MLVAPFAAQLRVLLVPELTVVGFAANEVIVGTAPLVDDDPDEVEAPPQPRSPQHADRTISQQSIRSRDRAMRMYLPNEQLEGIALYRQPSGYESTLHASSSLWSLSHGPFHPYTNPITCVTDTAPSRSTVGGSASVRYLQGEAPSRAKSKKQHRERTWISGYERVSEGTE